MKPLKDWSYNELVDEATRNIHLDLITSGGQGMRSAIWRWLSVAIDWRFQQDAEKKLTTRSEA